MGQLIQPDLQIDATDGIAIARDGPDDDQAVIGKERTKAVPVEPEGSGIRVIAAGCGKYIVAAVKDDAKGDIGGDGLKVGQHFQRRVIILELQRCDAVLGDHSGHTINIVGFSGFECVDLRKDEYARKDAEHQHAGHDLDKHQFVSDRYVVKKLQSLSLFILTNYNGQPQQL